MKMLYVKNQTDWAQKYRPQLLEDMILPATMKKQLISIRDTGVGPSLLFHGNAGLGKTTAGLLINKDNTFKYNCSIENGIKLVRDLSHDFTAPSLDALDEVRVILLDEADYLTKEAQAGLRAVLEELSFCNMFVLTANFTANIINPLRSRLVELNFDVIKGDFALRNEMLERTIQILECENVIIKADVVSEIVNRNFPDMRKVLKRCQYELAFEKVCA
jgi:DNA polymerase III delta prime subunit